MSTEVSKKHGSMLFNLEQAAGRHHHQSRCWASQSSGVEGAVKGGRSVPLMASATPIHQTGLGLRVGRPKGSA